MKTLLVLLRPFCATAILAGFLLIGPSHADTPHEIVTSVAQAIEEHYFDRSAAAAIRDDLARRALTGEFDAMDDAALAGRLTALLQQYDNHFEVTTIEAASGRSEAPPPTPERASNFGFQRVEILPGNIGYLDLRYFARIDFSKPDDAAHRTAQSALAMLSNSDAVIIDLRHNNGGAYTMSGYLISAFVDPEARVFNEFIYAGGTQSETPEIRYPSPMTSAPVFVLTSPDTFSAAESVAYSLQAAGRATIVGAITRGGANPGTTFDILGRFQIFVSLATPTNPITGHNWNGVGVRPNVEVPAPDALSTAQLLALDAMTATTHLNASDRAWIQESLQASLEPLRARADLQQYVGTYGPFTVSLRAQGLRVENSRGRTWSLRPISGDTFSDQDDPLVRFEFLRRRGDIRALERRYSDGRVRRDQRG